MVDDGYLVAVDGSGGKGLMTQYICGVISASGSRLDFSQITSMHKAAL